jgi:hypothetical protein
MRRNSNPQLASNSAVRAQSHVHTKTDYRHPARVLPISRPSSIQRPRLCNASTQRIPSADSVISTCSAYTHTRKKKRDFKVHVIRKSKQSFTGERLVDAKMDEL